jgi:hypothetical protein
MVLRTYVPTYSTYGLGRWGCLDTYSCADPPPSTTMTLASGKGPTYYPSTLAKSTLIILFCKMLKFSKIIPSKSKKY